jgi:hypothetical protein
MRLSIWQHLDFTVFLAQSEHNNWKDCCFLDHENGYLIDSLNCVIFQCITLLGRAIEFGGKKMDINRTMKTNTGL